MDLPSDNSYVETKLLKVGTQSLSGPFKILADWISAEYRVSVLNVIYDRIQRGRLPRLSVVLEREYDQKSFFGSDGNYDHAKQACIAQKFVEITEEYGGASFDTQQLLVVFAAFETTARLETIFALTDEEISSLKEYLAAPSIWRINKYWEGPTVFFFTDAQAQAAEGSNLKSRCADFYAGLLRAHDEFGYLRDCPVVVTFDSKENFETKYKGIWFDYDRR